MKVETNCLCSCLPPCSYIHFCFNHSLYFCFFPTAKLLRFRAYWNILKRVFKCQMCGKSVTVAEPFFFFFLKKLGKGFGVNKWGLDWTKRRVDTGQREVEEISAEEVMRAAKPSCSSSQIKTQTPQTYCHVNTFLPPKTLRYSISPGLCVFSPSLSPQGTKFSSLEGIALAIPRPALCPYMPARGLASDRPPALPHTSRFISNIPVHTMNKLGWE